MEHLDPDQIVLLALGEIAPTEPLGDGPARDVDGTSRHLRQCQVCRDELAQLTRTVELAREAGELGLQAPVVLPASLWNGIAADLGIGHAPDGSVESRGASPAQWVAGYGDADLLATFRSESGSADDRADTRIMSGGRRPLDARRRPRRSIRYGLLAAAAAAAVVVAVGAGIAGGVAIGRHEVPTSTATQSQAELRPMPAGPTAASGTATINQGVDGLTLNVMARQLPLRQGYYEVWLYNPTADQMVAVGTLGAGGNGFWTLASTIDLRSYSIVDVSAQNFDGNPAHRDSVLQGPLTQ